MKFRTTLPSFPKDNFISYNSEIHTVGSCFADSIGNRLIRDGFSATVNPFGIVFNPISIVDVFDHALSGKIEEELFIERSNHWFHFNYHSDMHAGSRNDLIELLRTKQEVMKTKLLNADVLVITFGTSTVYRHLTTNKIVTNCHKVPQQNFQKERLDLNVLKDRYTDFFEKLFAVNKKLKIILTVSPVRHIKDGLHENNLSKSILLLLSDYLQLKFDRLEYFPSYEIIVDDLRDYRFYKEDLIHPTEQAIDYVYNYFLEAFFKQETIHAIQVKRSIIKAQSHTFLAASNEEKNAHLKHISELEKEWNILKNLSSG